MARRNRTRHTLTKRPTIASGGTGHRKDCLRPKTGTGTALDLGRRPMKKNRISSTALVLLNAPAQDKTGLPAVTSRLPVTPSRLPARSAQRQSLILDREPPEYFGGYDETMRPRGRGQYQLRPPAEAAFAPGNAPYDYLRHTTVQALDYLLTPQLKRFMRYAAIGIAIIILAELLSSSGTGIACGMSIVEPAYPMMAGGTGG